LCPHHESGASSAWAWRPAARGASVTPTSCRRSIPGGKRKRDGPRSVTYFSQSRLMLESEQAINEHAHAGPLVTQRVCTQLLSEPTRYVRWHIRHEQRMGAVAEARRRQQQILVLRAFALEQIHASALVRYLRDYHVVGATRDRTLRDFFGVVDPRDAALKAHRDYLLAASSQVCAADLLELANDSLGVELLNDYEQAYGQFFSMFCESSRHKQDGEPYLLASLLPEVRTAANNLRRRIVEGDSRRQQRNEVQRLPPQRTLAIQSHTLVRLQRP
jgi:hypothetical protein